jgi:hypothetical protein
VIIDNGVIIENCVIINNGVIVHNRVINYNVPSLLLKLMELKLRRQQGWHSLNPTPDTQDRNPKTKHF